MSDTNVIAPQEPDDEALPGPLNKSPDLKRLRERRARYKGAIQKAFDWIVVPAEVPEEFNESLAVLRDSLQVAHPDTSDNVLAEAQAVFDEASERIDSAERRATALQGAVPIAASLVVAGSSFLLDHDKIDADAWQALLIGTLAIAVACLIACAWRALAVTGRMFEFEQPGTERITVRAKLVRHEALTFRAAELLRAGAVASEIGAVKVGLLRSAAWWLRCALASLAAFVGLLTAFVLFGDRPSAAPQQPLRLTVLQRTVTVRARAIPRSPVTGTATTALTPAPTKSSP
jgi:hypothetical protein